MLGSASGGELLANLHATLFAISTVFKDDALIGGFLIPGHRSSPLLNNIPDFVYSHGDQCYDCHVWWEDFQKADRGKLVESQGDNGGEAKKVEDVPRLFLAESFYNLTWC